VLSETTRAALEALDTLVGPQQLQELDARVKEAMHSIPRENELQAMMEESYLRTALALCLARSADRDQYFIAITQLEDVVEAEAVPRRLKMLARYYQSVLRLMGHYPSQDPNEIMLPPGEVLSTLAGHFQKVAELAEELGVYRMSGVCWSFAAECILRAGGDQAQAITLAGQANMAFMHIDDPENRRVKARATVIEDILSSGASALPPLADFAPLLYEPGELLTAA